MKKEVSDFVGNSESVTSLASSCSHIDIFSDSYEFFAWICFPMLGAHLFNRNHFKLVIGNKHGQYILCKLQNWKI